MRTDVLSIPGYFPRGDAWTVSCCFLSLVRTMAWFEGPRGQSVVGVRLCAAG